MLPPLPPLPRLPVLPLPAVPRLPRALRSRLVSDFKRFASGMPPDVESYIRDGYRVDVAGEYAGCGIRNPFGKASGQLSCTAAEVRGDAEAGLGFVVLKTVIAEDEAGARSMAEWAIHETAMRVEQIVSRAGREGWTVTWKGRGWDGSLEDYLAFYAEALAIGAAFDLPVAASVKYHLPPAGEPFREAEYAYTTGRLADMWASSASPEDAGSARAPRQPLILEKDFSPTLAGHDLAADRAAVLRWLHEVPGLIRRHAGPGPAPGPAPARAPAPAAPPAPAPAGAPLVLGLKLMNALMEDAFQALMVREASRSGADFLVLSNRLYDPEKGVAYGGWDLSDRNLRVLDEVLRGSGRAPGPDRPRAVPPISATGNICSGRMMVEYALRGATSGQIHTYFQLPLSEYAASAGSRSARALHSLLLHPDSGLLAWILHLGESGALEPRDGLLRFLDLGRRLG